jgi:branched-chain amino acid transport system substrate-binding protein
MFFPEGTAAHASPFAMASTLAKQTNKKKFGAMTCREAQGCRDADHYWFDLHDIERAGLTPGYRGQVSIAQPDYTAECLQAKNNGSDLLGTIADAASIIRIARDCARQAYHPVFISGLAALENRMASDPNLDGMFGMLDVFPWTLQSGGAAEFHAAMSKYAPGVELSGSASEGWASAKLFEKAFTAATAGGAPADREKLLTALYSMNGETLGGLTPPLTFVRGQPAPETKCWFYLQIQGGKWTSNGQVLCP